MKEKLIEGVLLPLEAAGFQAYFVGGCVRDTLRGQQPKDYDVVTNATPAQIKGVFSRISELSENSEPYGVTMPLIDDELVEIATMRRDMTKGRHPTVTFTSDMEEDRMRRDFTANALYEDARGKVIGPDSYVTDVREKVLRFVGDPTNRLEEDPLRAFRLVRFMSKGWISALTPAEAAKLPRPDYSEVSKERQLKEIRQIFAGPHFMDDDVQAMLNVLGIYDEIGVTALFADMASCTQSPLWHAEGSTWEEVQ